MINLREWLYQSTAAATDSDATDAYSARNYGAHNSYIIHVDPWPPPEPPGGRNVPGWHYCPGVRLVSWLPVMVPGPAPRTGVQRRIAGRSWRDAGGWNYRTGRRA